MTTRSAECRTFLSLWAGIALVALWSSLVAGMSWATNLSPLATETRLFLDRQQLSLPGDIEITVGEPDPRFNLAQCARYEPFIPNGARLWGRTNLGIRCVEGATWSLFIPVQIKVYAPTPVAARSIARGQPVGPDDVRLDRIDITQWPPGTLAAVDQLEGRLATRTIVAGEPLRRDVLRTPPVIVPGDPVKIVFAGGNFVVSTEGKATTLAAEGQAVQASVPGGKILSGIARTGKIVEVK